MNTLLVLSAVFVGGISIYHSFHPYFKTKIYDKFFSRFNTKTTINY